MPSFLTPEPVTLSIELAAGSVDVATTDTGRTEVDLAPVRVDDRDARALIDQARIGHDGGTVFVHVPEGVRAGFLRRTPAIAVRVSVPAGSSLDASVRSADLRTRGRLGETRVGSASGDVQLDECAGDAVVRSASGDVRLGRVAGEAEIRTASGDVSIDAAGATTSVRTASGGVVVDGITGGRTDVSTMSGDVRVSVAPGLAVWLDVSSVSGDVRSSLDPRDEAGSADDTAEISVHTVSGDVAVTAGRPPRPATAST